MDEVIGYNGSAIFENFDGNDRKGSCEKNIFARRERVCQSWMHNLTNIQVRWFIEKDNSLSVV